jgi:hypothetical protein
LPMITREINEFLSDFRSHAHLILFYYEPEAKREILFSHLKFGEEKQGLAYVCSEENPQQIRGGMKKFGIDADGLRTRGKLAISNYDEIYLVDHVANIAKIMTAFSEMTEKYRLMGLDGMRAAAEMTCFFREDKVKELMAYEYALHRRLRFPAEGICAYNIREMQSSGCLETIMPMIRAHDTVILAGPNESLLLDPVKVEQDEVEEAMQIEIKV